MQNIKRRIAALEDKARTGDGSMKVVIVEDGETKAEAWQREGYAPDVADVMCVVFVSGTDARL